MSADVNDPAGLVVQHHGQVALTLADGDLIDRQNTKLAKIRLTIVGFQILLVDVFDCFPVQLKMPGDIGDCHHLAQLMDRSGHPSGHPQIGVKQFQILDADALAVGAKQFAVLAAQPNLGAGEVQISYLALGPTVNRR